MVRRLIQEDNVGVLQRDGRENDTRLLASRQVLDGDGVRVAAQAKTAQQVAQWLVADRRVQRLQVLHGRQVHRQDVHKVLTVPRDADATVANDLAACTADARGNITYATQEAPSSSRGRTGGVVVAHDDG